MLFRNSIYCDYQTERQKEKKAEMESDLNSDIEDNNKRRRIQEIYSSDEDEEVDTILKRPPQLITGKRLSAIRKNTSSATSLIADVDDVNSINVTPTTSTNKEFTSNDYSTTIVLTLSLTTDAVTSTPKQDDLVLDSRIIKNRRTQWSRFCKTGHVKGIIQGVGQSVVRFKKKEDLFKMITQLSNNSYVIFQIVKTQNEPRAQA
ncbi:hypothetical protein FQA39_LY03854 [Lamprigera yunnana]|nr:hypothetical protein FQA39_LY03854 [Lamprigera yunnana]